MNHAYFRAKLYHFVIDDFIIFPCSTGFVFEAEILYTYAECFLLVLDTCESVPFLYLLQTCRHKMFARTCFTTWDQVFTQELCREILDKVLLLTVKSAVDLGNGLR
jgi:hypothetical protein